MSSLFSVAGREPFKRAQRGLYGGKTRLSGNMRSFSERKTRRAWLPNVQRKKLYSEILDQSIRLNVTPFVLRWIDRVGGLDNYLLRTSDAKLASAKAIELKNQLKQVLEERNTSGAAAAQVE